MKNPDLFDAILDRALQDASHGLEGETFTRQLTERIAQQQRWMRVRRQLPAIMGGLATIVVLLVARPKLDFQGVLSLLAAVQQNGRFALAWLMQPIPGAENFLAQNFLVLWFLLAGMAVILSHWLANRESAIFRV
jgi:hypothetical protein